MNTDRSRRQFVRKSSNTKCYYINVISFIPNHWQDQEFDWIFPSSLIPYKVYRPKNSWFPCNKGLNQCCFPKLYGGIRKSNLDNFLTRQQPHCFSKPPFSWSLSWLQDEKMALWDLTYNFFSSSLHSLDLYLINSKHHFTATEDTGSGLIQQRDNSHG